MNATVLDVRRNLLLSIPQCEVSRSLMPDESAIGKEMRPNNAEVFTG